jgi:hypothetical protein
MPASEAQIRANQANSLKSCGPKTSEGKLKSRANAYTHGMTATVVIPDEQAAEVERRVEAFEAELNPSGEVGRSLVRLAATMSVRMQRCADQENAMLAERVRQAEADFVPPEEVDDATAARLRTEAGKRALFDPSPEAGRARQYEASAVRGFFRALKELRQVEKAAKETAAEAESKAVGAEIEERAYREALALFSSQVKAVAPAPPVGPSASANRPAPDGPADLSQARGWYDLPSAIGEPR